MKYTYIADFFTPDSEGIERFLDPADPDQKKDRHAAALYLNSFTVGAIMRDYLSQNPLAERADIYTLSEIASSSVANILESLRFLQKSPDDNDISHHTPIECYDYLAKDLAFDEGVTIFAVDFETQQNLAYALYQAGVIDPEINIDEDERPIIIRIKQGIETADLIKLRT
jgi:hypothetical protein